MLYIHIYIGHRIFHQESVDNFFQVQRTKNKNLSRTTSPFNLYILISTYTFIQVLANYIHNRTVSQSRIISTFSQ